MKVAKIIDMYTIAVTISEDQPAALDDVLHISNDIIDPETGDVIGEYPDVRLIVTEVHPRFCVAKTMYGQPQAVMVNIGDDATIAT